MKSNELTESSGAGAVPKIDVLLDVTPYEELTTGMLQYLASTGDAEAAEELRRRVRVEVLGPDVEDVSPVAGRSDEVLVKQIAVGDEAAAAEFERRYPRNR